jgi:hypothetical protein
MRRQASPPTPTHEFGAIIRDSGDTFPVAGEGALPLEKANMQGTILEGPEMKPLIANPVNSTQEEFNNLTELSGGFRGGPAPIRVKELLRSSGKKLNALAYREMNEHLKAFPSANPWHICFAVGLAWGHLARLELEFTEAAIGALNELNDVDLRAAASFHLERGPEPIDQSLRGAFLLFSQVVLPPTLPNSLKELSRAQERWISPIIGPSRPRYIGSWNATAMFMTALFAQPELAAIHRELGPVLPPGGPIFAGLQILYKAGVLTTPPEGSELDDQAFEPGALYLNNRLFVDLLSGLDDWCLVDVHSGVYMLGTRDAKSRSWA